MTGRRFFIVLLMLSGLLAQTGCGNGGSPAGGEKILVYARGGDSKTYDPIATDSGEAATVLTNLFETLVTYAETKNELVPGLAESWQTSDDQLTWTFKLRPGVKFHDGTPCDAAAVVFSMERLYQDKHPARYSDQVPYAPSFSMIESVKAPDPLTVVFKLNRPAPVFLGNLAMFPASIVSPAAVNQHKQAFGRQPVGTGPFKFVSWNIDQKVALAAFDEYWQGRPKIDRLIFTTVKESAVRVKQIERGEAHLADNLPPAELDALAKNSSVVIQEQPGLNVGYLTIQVEKAPLNVPKVRQAIWHAIDKSRLINVVYSGHGESAVNIVPKRMWAHNDTLKDRTFDIAKAKQLLDEAAKENGISLPISITLSVMDTPRPYLQLPQQTATFLKDSLAEIGINLQVKIVQLDPYFQMLSEGKHELGLIGWSSDNLDPDNFLYTLLDPDNINDQGGSNSSRWRSPEFHQLMIDAQKELDPAKRKQMYLQAQQLAWDAVPVIPLVHTNVRVAVRSNVKGYQLHPSSLVRLRTTSLD